MPTDDLLLSRDDRQWVLTTAVRFSGSDFGQLADSSNPVRIVTRPHTLLLRGWLFVVSRDTDFESYADVGIESDPDLYSASPLDIVAVGEKALSIPAANAYLPESTTIYVTYADANAQRDGEYILHIEYLIVGRSNESYS